MLAALEQQEQRRAAQAVSVNVVPGLGGRIRGIVLAVEIAVEIGYPIMMKASAGGGDKGMRVAFSDICAGFKASKRDGPANFGDDRVFIESPRHTKIHVLSGQRSTILPLSEQEFSARHGRAYASHDRNDPDTSVWRGDSLSTDAVMLKIN